MNGLRSERITGRPSSASCPSRRDRRPRTFAALAAVGLVAASVVGAMLVAVPAVASAASGQGRFVPVTPVRILDTGSGVGAPRAAVPAHGTISFAVAGAGGLPSSGVTAVALNVTTAAQTAPGYVTAYPAGTARPTTSSANFPVGQATANVVLVKVGAAGKVSVYNGSSGTIRLVADVSGYFTTASGPTTAFLPVTPARILDTGTGLGAARAAVPAHATITFSVAGRGGVPASGITAVALTVTTAAQTRAGYVTAYPAGAARPSTSSVNFPAGRATANTVLVKLGTAGKVSVYNGSSGAIRLVADVSGYFTTVASGPAASFVPVTPTRILDTGSGIGAYPVAVPAHGTIVFSVAGKGGLPSSGITAAALNVTTADQAQAGFVTVYPTGSARPATSNVNFAAERATANIVLVALGPANDIGHVTIYNGSTGAIRVVADVAGYFTTQPAWTASAVSDFAPNALTCLTASTCTSVGNASTPAGSRPAAMTITDGAVTQTTELPGLTGGHYSYLLSGVSCPSSDVCTAVGEALDSPNGTDTRSTPVVETLAAGKWTATGLPVPSGFDSGGLDSVSCTDAAHCAAVGSIENYDSNTFTDHPLIEVYRDGAWTPTSVPVPAGTTSADLRGVSCVGPSTCFAVGTADLGSGNNYVPIVESYNGATWAVTIAHLPDGTDSTGLFNAISCSTATACTAVGDRAAEAVASIYTGSDWVVSPVISAPGHSGGELNSVSCTAPGSCTAAGSDEDYDSYGAPLPLVQTLTGTTWMASNPPLPAVTVDGSLNAVSCFSAIDCTALGTPRDFPNAFIETR